MTTATRESACYGLIRRVHELATSWETIDELFATVDTIRNLLGEAGFTEVLHVGIAPEEFDPLMVAEWTLGGWAACLRHPAYEKREPVAGVMFLQLLRNSQRSLERAEEKWGPLP